MDNQAQSNVASKTKEQVMDSPFVMDEDVFDIVINYYKEGKRVIVEGLNDNFVKSKKVSNITFTIRYPTAGDLSLINQKLKTSSPNENMGLRELFDLELLRATLLMKKWSLKEELNNENLLNLDPDIVKQLIIKIREEIGLSGII